jgi:hypothetical protein
MNEFDFKRGRTAHDELKALTGDGDIEHQIERIVNPKALSDISRMSADAMLAQYEAAAKAVEEMGVSASRNIARIGEALAAEIAEAAAVIRGKGKLAQSLVEDAGTLTRDIRDTCNGIKRKVGG